jgi:plasmid stabilization system protein ParE
VSLYALTPHAEDDLFAVWSYIAADSVEAANRVESEIYAACKFLSANRQAGHVRRDLTTRPVRIWSLPRFPNYVLVYDPDSEPLSIIRVFHGALDISRHLEDPE